MPLHPPHHHGPHHEGPPHHRWLVAHHDAELAREEYGRALVELGTLISKSSTVDINNTAVRIPGYVDFELVYERTPHGSLALRMRAEWIEDLGGPTTSQNGSLTFRVPHEDEA